MTEVLIIGAGPGGLHAARSALDAGAQVTLLDSHDLVGGQFWRHLPPERAAAHQERLHHGWKTFQRLRFRLEADLRCRILTSTEVWAIEPGTDGAAARVHALTGPSGALHREEVVLTPDRLVLATGAHDRVLPFPGWELPGVFSAGAAQALAKGERVAVGDRVLVAGAGPFLLATAASLVATGVTVLGVHEAAGAPALRRGWLSRPWELARSGSKLKEFTEYAGLHLRHRIPYLTGSAVIAAQGDGRVESVRVARLDDEWQPISGTERDIPVDAVAVSHGFTPRLELAIAAGCRITAHRFVEIADDQRTTVPGVYAAGELTGVGGMALSAAEGAIAGYAAAGGAIPEQLLSERARHRAFALRIERAHGIRPGWTDWLTDDTTICRCEDVPYRDLALDDVPSRSLRASKLATRAGLGICQGRTCGRTVEDLLGRGPGLLGTTTTDRRPIAAPVRLGEFARD
ncbi:FAD-dependent oxidoreductase [Flexivirga oryzae]|uniref:NADPH-dependent 2,4-dienoyl-CoA reductase/sulfur reductase-like enzyme n=1 Tax=Flexivirga oryzae TaxID=1794944 RepID=A0A839N714_9MICO|nr:FAD-dependent oxidoreductase [Flexivirga oryzae]MBB2893540.1 NADPH-dependent 2,4-dienoyl-CoA reductase/sulfur reductase-like enzyme [Flexivirga oryzae]